MFRRHLIRFIISLLMILAISLVGFAINNEQTTKAQIVLTLPPQITFQPTLPNFNITLPPTLPPTQPSGSGTQNDADGDGILDSNDACPFVSGIGTRYGGRNGPDGCPVDSDNDGINDGNDRCPFTAGTAANNGCATGGNQTVPTNTPQSAVPLPNLPTTGGCAIATESRVNVNRRQGPSTSTSIIGEIDPLSVYQGVEQSSQPDGTWYRLQSGGWVAGYVVRTNSACSSLPFANASTGESSTGPSQPQVVTATPNQSQIVTATPSVAPRVITATPSQSQVITATPDSGSTNQTTAPPTILTWSDIPNTAPLDQTFVDCEDRLTLIEQLPSFVVASLVLEDAPCTAAENTIQRALTENQAESMPPSQAVVSADDGNLYRVSTSDDTLIALTSSSATDSHPAVDPTGQRVAFIRTDANGALALNVLNTQQSVMSEVFVSSDLIALNDIQPEWINESELLVTMESDGVVGLYRLGADGDSLPTMVVEEATHADYSENLNIIAYQQTTNGISNIYTAAPNGDNPIQVTAVRQGSGCHSPTFGGDRLYFICDGTLYRYDTGGINAVSTSGGQVSSVAAGEGGIAYIVDGVPFIAGPIGNARQPLLTDSTIRIDSIGAASF